MGQGLVAWFVDTSSRLGSELHQAEALPRGSPARAAAVAGLAHHFVAFGVAEERLLFRPIERAGGRVPEPLPALVREQRRLVHRALPLQDDRQAELDADFIAELETHLDDETKRLLPGIEAYLAREPVARAPVWYADELFARFGECGDCCPEHWLG